ncbi:hypothetical protein [Dactylosporangium sp. NPDC051541]|uniref:hypothetical protein n=1 Tax=Dactylosporangium sp. NPDC051541 TaxID=3363977 RepID=UPI0037996DD1
MLYVVFDDTGPYLVGRDDPARGKSADRREYDGVIAIRLDGEQAAGPDLSRARLLTGSALVIVAGAGLAATALVPALLVVPVGVAVAAYLGRRHSIAAAEVERRWASRNRWLETREARLRVLRAFNEGAQAAQLWEAAENGDKSDISEREAPGISDNSHL